MKSQSLSAVLLHSHVNTTVMLIDSMVAKKVFSPGEGAAMMLKFADELQDDAEKAGVLDVVKPLVSYVHENIANLNALKVKK